LLPEHLLTVALNTESEWPDRATRGLPEEASQSRAVLSSLAVRMREPSGLNTAPFIALE